MDLIKIINELQNERQKLNAIIRSLELLNEAGSGKPGEAPARRGRRFMGTEDRLEVSRRMKKYWEERKKQQGKAAGSNGGAKTASGA